MQIIERLRQDHRNMARILGLIEIQLGRLHATEPIDFEMLTQAVRYMMEFTDVIHHPAEDVLFEKLRIQDRSLDSIITTLEQEHELLRHNSQTLYDTVRGAALGHGMMREELERSGRDYIATQYAHMRTEETEILPRVHDALPVAELIDVEYLLASCNDPVFGDTIERDYRKFYDYLVANTDK